MDLAVNLAPAGGNFAANAIAGILWTVFSPTVAFAYLPAGCCSPWSP
ncbi:hypothetical protein [Micromonospora pisi]|nr:hypothetical protein [Micromonospora pisi]